MAKLKYIARTSCAIQPICSKVILEVKHQK